ncbi:MAG: pyridoxamine 5'-phosphate oxidase family protein [Pseudomonadota bacterium]|nr:pyridoxamine 5'-phosphate oxidase family protein [Pseudomonadota bacterium]
MSSTKSVNGSSRRELSEIECAEVLARPISATIAFLDGDGFPRMAPCWFLWSEEAFHTTSEPDKYHVKCLSANSRGSFCVEVADVTPSSRSNKQVKGIGRFEIVREGITEITSELWTKYLGTTKADGLSDNGRIVLRLRPDSISAHGSEFSLKRE